MLRTSIMTKVRLKTEKSPNCEVAIKWEETPGKHFSEGTCPKCGRVFRSEEIRFL